MNRQIAAAAMVAAVLTAAACSSGSGIHGSTTGTVGHVPCHQQYETWKHGPAKADVDRMIATFQAGESAAGNQDLLKAESSLKAAGAAAMVLQGDPLPSCADPHGYWHTALARITAGADDLKAQPGLGGLLLAKGPLSTVLPLLSKLYGELVKQFGQNY